ncbi:MAG: hypothetical protein COW65_09970 [Cytophagales bacterium CG18_big_fil_WC_8_21_14_2_50_42_9]|nr:MAG: hypothetical protein COW65_09970 [Cytophagales bacterium CG18_big_fil_WC_8_21_14_2_50_42_9]
MIIHTDSLMELVYEPKTDILSVKWPDLIDVPISVIQHSFSKLVDSINHYHITKLLLDSKSTVSNVSDEEYKPLAMKLVMSLGATSLKKIARIISEDQLRENRAKTYSQELQSQMTLNFKSKEFDNKESALAWLTSAQD